MNKADKSQKTETAFKLFDKNRDGYITRDEFTKVQHCYCIDEESFFYLNRFQRSSMLLKLKQFSPSLMPMEMGDWVWRSSKQWWRRVRNSESSSIINPSLISSCALLSSIFIKSIKEAGPLTDIMNQNKCVFYSIYHVTLLLPCCHNPSQVQVKVEV